MYFWKTKGLIGTLQDDQVTLFDIVGYATLLSITFLLSINLITLLPTLYKLTFSYAKVYLEKQAAPAALVINVFDTMKEFFIIANIIILCAGILFSLLVSQATLKKFFIRAVALAWSICFRIILVTTIIFAIIVGILGLYFGYKLLLITKMPTPKGPVALRPLKYLFKITGTYTAAKAVWAQAHNLAQAQIIFDQINRVSYYTYWICQAGSIFCTMWWMLTLQEKIRLINKNK